VHELSNVWRGHGDHPSWPLMAVVSTSDLTPAATYQNLMERCERRLKEIANQDNDTIMTTTRWGDKPYCWDRL
jgi:hypothetical protein